MLNLMLGASYFQFTYEFTKIIRADSTSSFKHALLLSSKFNGINDGQYQLLFSHRMQTPISPFNVRQFNPDHWHSLQPCHSVSLEQRSDHHWAFLPAHSGEMAQHCPCSIYSQWYCLFFTASSKVVDWLLLLRDSLSQHTDTSLHPFKPSLRPIKQALWDSE